MYAQTPRTTALRLRDRTSYDESTVHAILDEAYHCHLGFIVDGQPRVLPTLHVRLDDIVYVHGSTGSRPLLAARDPDGLPVCLTVTLLDGLVLARSQFHHSVNYRSVVAHGLARPVSDPALRRRVLHALVDKVVRGRAADSRPPTDRELAQTAVLALPLREVSAKVRTGGVADDPEDLGLPHWAGVVPLRLTAGAPVPDGGLTVALPEYLRPVRSPWLTAEPMRGERVVLAPLDLSHVDGLYTATGDEEVWLSAEATRPASREEMADLVADALRMHADGVRVPWVLRCARTGEVLGATSYHAPDQRNRSLAIGYRWLGRRWWRTAVENEADALLLSRAFDDLEAVRVEWHLDRRDDAGQRGVERLGATREGVLRRHRRRPDGGWQDTAVYAMTADEWPTARQRLAERLVDG
jgi:nitroimidazol reductase NimA-like FMN-containing flavoprotein (pyridoxamine 5'-phosphate oxidase superfamily)/RimJ/RimL family protein N-acetyltransferase